MSGVSSKVVTSDEEGMRLDRWFKSHFPTLGFGRLQKLLRSGQVRVDGKRAKSNFRLEAGQTIRIPPISDERPEVRDEASIRDREALEAMTLHDDGTVLVLNKPAGLAVQGGPGLTRHVDGMLGALTSRDGQRPRLVHRLDRETSGVLLIAKTRLAAKSLAQSFKERETRKIYWAAVAGVPHPRMGTIKYGVVKAPGHGKGGEGEKIIAVHPMEVDQTEGAKRAVTDYAVLAQAGSRACWAALIPVTGRTHQLRAHMAEIGHPIVGDGKYGGSSQDNLGDGWGAQLGGEISRKLHLHARRLSFRHPVTGRDVNLTAKLPPHMARTWDMLDWHERDVPVDPFDPDEGWA